MWRPLTRVGLVAPALGLVLLAAMGLVAPPVALGADGIAIRTAARYVVAPEDARIRVSVDVNATNQKPNRDSGGAVTRYYYDGVNLGVQREARNIRATQDGVGLRVTTAPRDGYRLVTVFFRSPIFYGERAKVRLQFDLPAGKPRSSSDVRVGPAFASFLAWSFGDAGTIRVDVPAAFEVDISGAEMTRTVTESGVQVYRAHTDDALSWFAWVNARNDDGLTRRALSLAGGDEVLVRAWPEDLRWQRRVAAVLGDGIPALTSRIGLPWPVDGALSVLEIHTPLLEGYAGFYNPSTDEITISEELDDVTIVHEASHAWFNQRLFTERWITEGLAETYAADVVRAIGGETPTPAKVAPDEPAAFPLDEWPPPAAINDDVANDRELFGYRASAAVMARIVESAGEDGMQRVFAAADAGTTAFTGDAPPERSTIGDNDWRRFLDLTEQVGGADGVEDLLRTWALTDEEAALLPARDEALAAYDRLVTDGDEWAAPVGVRLAMDGWRFDEAGAGIAAASGILEDRATIDGLATGAALEAPAGLEADYEAARTAEDLRAVAGDAAASAASLKTVIAASEALAAPRDWLTELGLQGKTPDSDLTAARVAWEQGDPGQASMLASTAAGTLAAAAEAGRGRATLIGGLLVLAVLLVVVVLVGRRRAGRRREAHAVLASRPAPVGPLELAPTPTLDVTAHEAVAVVGHAPPGVSAGRGPEDPEIGPPDRP
jgi:hypothetical protein